MSTTITPEFVTVPRQNTHQSADSKGDIFNEFLIQFGRIPQVRTENGSRFPEDSVENEVDDPTELLENSDETDEDNESDLHPKTPHGQDEFPKVKLPQTPFPTHFLAHGWQNAEPKLTKDNPKSSEEPNLISQQQVVRQQDVSLLKNPMPNLPIGLPEGPTGERVKGTMLPEIKLDDVGTSIKQKPDLDMIRGDSDLGHAETVGGAIRVETSHIEISEAKTLAHKSGVILPEQIIPRGFQEALKTRKDLRPAGAPPIDRPRSHSETPEIVLLKNETKLPKQMSDLPLHQDISQPLESELLEIDQGGEPAKGVSSSHHFLQPSAVTLPSAKAALSQSTATAVAQQMAVAISQNPDGTTELVLNPEELGRVSLTMKTHDGTAMLVVLTERPETQDLMKRHIDALTQELRTLGFNNVEYSFSEARSDQGRQGTTQNKPSEQMEETDEIVPSPHNATVHQDGLDLRL